MLNDKKKGILKNLIMKVAKKGVKPSPMMKKEEMMDGKGGCAPKKK
jgi:hypothetical protein